MAIPALIPRSNLGEAGSAEIVLIFSHPASNQYFYKKVLESTIFYRRVSMNLQEVRRIQVGHSLPEACVSNFGSVLISAIIVGFALIIITIFASFELLVKNSIK
ncbi:MAG: hypothetical protein WBV23_06970 [Desulfobaccales bacterium]